MRRVTSSWVPLITPILCGALERKTLLRGADEAKQRLDGWSHNLVGLHEDSVSGSGYQ